MIDRPHEPRPVSLSQHLIDFHERLVAGDESPSTEALPEVDLAHLAQLKQCLVSLEGLRAAMSASPSTHGLSEGNDDLSTVAGLTAEAATDSLEPEARRVGRFVVHGLLGSGGQGMVFRAYDPHLQRDVALKLPRPEILVTPSLRRRFLDEARFAARLSHPHLATVFEVGEIGPICYIASEFCDGPNLAQWLAAREQPVEIADATRLMLLLASTVCAMHQCQVLHRDLKPSNVLLSPAEDSPRDAGGDSLSTRIAKITDFGLARLLDPGDAKTRTGMVLGTPAYMSPEQARGNREQIGPATDVYSLGAMLYELLSGRPPFRGDSEAETLAQVLGGELVPPRNLRPAIPRDLEAICLRALARDPLARYASAEELSADVRRFVQGEPTHARPLSAFQQTAAWARRRPAQAALVLVSLAALVTIAAGATAASVQLNRALETAQANASAAAQNHQSTLREEQRANLHLYASQMQLASLAFEQIDHPRAEELLASHGDGTPTAHLRGLEWYILREAVNRVANRGEQSTTISLPHPDELYGVAYAPDGKWLATACKDGCVRIWDTEKLVLVHTLPPHASCANVVKFSPDGRCLASGSCDQTVRLWKLNGKQMPVLERSIAEHTAAVHAVAFSPDSRQLASGDDRGQFIVREIELNREIHKGTESGRPLTALLWSPNGSHLVATRSFPDTVGWWDTSTWVESTVLLGHNGAFSPDSSTFATMDVERIHLFVPPSTTPIGTIENLNRCRGLAWSPNGRFLATAKNGSNLVLYDQHERRTIAIHTHLGGMFEGLEFSPDNDWVATVGRDGQAGLTRIVQHTTWQPTNWWSPGEPTLANGRHVTFDERRQMLVFRSKAEIVELDLASRVQPKHFKFPTGTAWTRVSSRGRTALFSHDGQVLCRDIESGQTIPLPPELARGAVNVLCSDESGTLVVISNENQIRVVDWPSLQLRLSIPYDLNDYKAHMPTGISPDGQYLAMTTTWRNIALFDLKRGTQRHVAGSFCSIDNDRIYALEDRAFTVRDRQTLAVVQSVTIDSPWFESTVSPDGHMLAASDSRHLSLWDLRTGQELMSLPVPWLERPELHFTDDGNRLNLTGFRNGRLELYQWSKPAP